MICQSSRIQSRTPNEMDPPVAASEGNVSFNEVVSGPEQ